MQVVCKCKPSLFAYPPPVTQEAAAAAAKVPTAVLSTTARARDKAKKKEKKKAEAAPAPPANAPGAHAGFVPTRVVRCQTCMALHGTRFSKHLRVLAGYCRFFHGSVGEASLCEVGCILLLSQVRNEQ